MTTESLNNVASRNSADGVTCGYIWKDKEIAANKIRSGQSPRDNKK